MSADNPAVTTGLLLEVLAIMEQVRKSPEGDGVLRTRAAIAEGRLRGQLLTALPDRIELRNAA
jgi:hypothetical protein